MGQELNMMLHKAKYDQAARESLINSYRDYIAKVTSKFCKRYLFWENDDELSIGLIAFNEAIDSYDHSKGISFLNYANIVMQRRLTDYFRKEAKFKEVTVALSIAEEDEEKNNSLETKVSLDSYYSHKQDEEKKSAVQDFVSCLAEFNFTLDDLIKNSPKHRDTRENLTRVARTLVNNQELATYLKNKKQLPLKELVLATGLSEKVLKSKRKYIIAIALIMMTPECFPLRQFLDLST